MSNTYTAKVLLILGSTRVSRISPAIANWIQIRLEKTYPTIEFSIIDLAELDIPMHSLEPHEPKSGIYMQPGTIEWSNIVKSASGIIFITPVYNHSYPAAIKNALDYLKAEWINMPAAVVSYSKRLLACGAEDLARVLRYLKMKVAEPYALIDIHVTDADCPQAAIDHAEAAIQQSMESLKKLMDEK
ncbi:flavoprotein-like protein [Dipodascopsis uninucleata]